MYKCLYCNIVLRKGTEKIFEEHECGHRHKMNKNILFKKRYLAWLETKNTTEE